MKIFVKVLIAVLLYLVFLVALLPARVVVALAPLPNGVSLAGVSGTLWQGSADTLVADGRQLEQVQWHLSPWQLITATVNLDVTFGGSGSAVTGKGNVSYSPSGIKLNSVKFDAPVSFLVGRNQLPFQTKASGDISLFVQQFEQGTPWCEQLAGKAFLNNIGITNRFGQYPLGDIELALQCVNGQVQLATDDEKNKLGIAGTLSLQDGMKYQLNGRMKVTADQPADLQKALPMLGKADANGFYPLTFSGRF
ncbi:type II secretion system protein N [Shewanella sp. C32]|uniref:Type II secretion system protein N n=1 Tax=Shewanella electrica TaxID=515560 RepID=A0ABT2FQL0_9GAMM|nr:type II secretion system protein N [Shewanella electrica]MCH1925918.1 type II secretion system protein N [Shewanella electrica]MCS4557476.1 type II secretion system protein N [Shewanella electrica]